jgi:nitroimidazol reductase NimA-like FMN-containing flavoprotein (pyridoxamine 5'-phosphate oxidase superfamily)
MRRKEMEITDRQLMEKVLKEAEIIRLAMVDDGDPYLVAMNFAYACGSLYMHSAREGRKVDALKKNNRVSFQTETGVEILIKDEACGCSTRYTSVFGTGRAVFVDDRAEKIEALDAIMAKYAGKAGLEYPEKALDRTLIIRVDIEAMTGKKCPA